MRFLLVFAAGCAASSPAGTAATRGVPSPEPAPPVARPPAPQPVEPPAPPLPVAAEWLDPFPRTRLRSHVGHDLVRDTPKTWAGPPVPAFVPQVVDDLRLVLLDAGPGGWFALYRDLYGPDEPLDWRNKSFHARLYRADGALAWAVDLNDFFSRPEHIEVQDARLVDGVLYFNEACQTYAREAGGACSALVALAPAERRILWRTPALVSNSRVVPFDRWVITGYGFTDERDFVSIVRRADGAVVATAPLASAPERYAIEGGEGVVLRVRTYLGEERFRLEGLDGDAPRLLAPRP